MATRFKKKMIKLFKHPVLFFEDALEKRKHSSFLEVTSASSPKTATQKVVAAAGKVAASLGAKSVPVNAVVAKKATYKEYFEEITNFAARYNVNSIKVNEEFMWPYIRNIFWVHLSMVATGRVAGKTVGRFSLQNGHFSQLPLKFRNKLKETCSAKDISELERGSCDFLFIVSANSTEQIEIHSKIYHRITDPLLEVAEKIGKPIKMEMIKSSSFDQERWEMYTHKSQLVLPPQIEKAGFAQALTYDGRYFAMMKQYVPSLNPMDHTALSTIINYDLYTRDYYLEILKRLNPKVICLFAFHYNAPLISAADELGIVTVDIQHGLQVGWNPLYNNYDELPKAGYQALPDYFAVWGSKEYKNILKTFRGEKCKPIYMGSPWLKKISTFPASLRGDIAAKLPEEKLKVLLIMQNQTAIPKLFLDIIEQSSNDIIWVVRHHPKGQKYTAKDFSKSKNVLIDEEIDKVLFNELFKYVDVTISEGSALAIEASYFGVHNIIVGETGKDNYQEEISKGLFSYLEQPEDFKEILEKIDQTQKSDVVHGFEDVEPEKFLRELLSAYSHKKAIVKEGVTARVVSQEGHEQNIKNLKEQMYLEAMKGNIDRAVDVFYRLRKLLSETPSAQERVAADQDIWIKEAKVFQRKNKLISSEPTENDVIMITDSLGLPRPNEVLSPDMGIKYSSTYMFNNELVSEHSMTTWAQRYLTTDKLLENWEMLVGNPTDKHLVVHLGLNDSAERIFLEDQRLSLDACDVELKNDIVNFGQTYRKQIISRQGEHCYVTYNQFKRNLIEIVERGLREKAKSITFVNIIPFPKSHEIDTPGSLENTAKFNQAFYELKRQYPQINIIELDKIVSREGFEKCMLKDNMHLSHFGHKILANKILTLVSNTNEDLLKKIAIIGAGQLGSRHLQGLKSISVNAQIELVEPNQQMRQIAIQRYNELPVNENILSVSFKSGVEELSDDLDLVIIATNSDIRANVLKSLLEAKNVKNIVLEKVLFQDINDYEYFEQYFSEKGIRVWVNHPRREFTFYDQFLSDIRSSKSISYHVQGAHWGMASNGLHFLDHLLFLSGQDNPQVNIYQTELCNYVQESKRAGFYEIFGTLVGNIGKSNFSLSCERDIQVGSTTTITILADNVRLMIDDYKGKVLYAYRDNDWTWETKEEKIIAFQSELTGIVADTILKEGSCRLPTYKEATLLHKPYINVVKEIIEKNMGKEFDICPIS